MVLALLALSVLVRRGQGFRIDRGSLRVALLCSAFVVLGSVGMPMFDPKLLVVGVALIGALVGASRIVYYEADLIEELLVYCVVATLSILIRGLAATLVYEDHQRVSLKPLWIAFPVLLISSSRRRGFQRIALSLVTGAACASAVAFDASRQTVVALLVGAILFVARSMASGSLKSRLVSLVLVVSIASAVAGSEASSMVLLRLQGGGSAAQSDDQRSELLRESVESWRRAPVLGHGAGSFASDAKRRQLRDPNGALLLSPHSFILLILVETGVVGGILWLSVYLVAVGALVLSRRDELSIYLWLLSAFSLFFSDFLGTERGIFVLAVACLAARHHDNVIFERHGIWEETTHDGWSSEEGEPGSAKALLAVPQ